MEDELKETREHLWGSLSYRVDKIADEADRIGWNAMIDMVADAFNDGAEMDTMDLFLNLYQFFFRLHYRLKAMTAPEPFNQITRTTRLENHDDREFFMVKNYDYNMFKWAMQQNLAENMTNSWFLVPVDKLSASQKHNFERRLS